MDTSAFHPKALKSRGNRGFTLMEVMLAVFVLAFGLLGLAGFMSQMSGSTSQSRYMELSSMLASEKLEDLNRIPNTDPAMISSGGSLTSPVTATFTVAGSPDVVAYFDSVQISNSNGAAVETIQGSSNGVQGFWTMTHTAGGQASAVFSTGNAPAPGGDVLTFKRFWQVVANPTIGGQVVNGIRRVTVVVTLTDPPTVAGRSAGFQASMVRP